MDRPGRERLGGVVEVNEICWGGPEKGPVGAANRAQGPDCSGGGSKGLQHSANESLWGQIVRDFPVKKAEQSVNTKRRRKST